MFTKQELRDLASYVLEDTYFVSLFLNVDPKDNPKEDWQLHFKNLVKETLSKVEPSARNMVQAEIEHIERYLADRPDGMKRGLAIFCSQALDLWRVYHVAIPFRNELVVDHDPYIKPLMSMLDQYQRYLVVVVGREKARLLIARMGEIEEVSAIDKRAMDVDLSRDSGRGDRGQHRAQRQMEKHRKWLFKDAIAVMEQTLATEGIKRVLLGGTDKERGHFKGLLSDSLKEKIVGEFPVDRNAGDTEILEQFLPAMKEVEYQFERKALDELFDQAGQRNGSVLGLSDVLTALQQGNVHKLYVLSSVITPGMVCKRCSALTPERDRPCPYCGGEMQHVPHMLDLAIQMALEQGSRVDMLDEAPRLEKAGGIGALLRY